MDNGELQELETSSNTKGQIRISISMQQDISIVFAKRTSQDS